MVEKKVNINFGKGLSFKISPNNKFRNLFIKNYKVVLGEVSSIINNYDVNRVILESKIDSNIFNELKNILYVLFYDCNKTNFENIYALKDVLSLDIDETFKANIDFGKFENLSELNVEWNPNLRFFSSNSLKSITLRAVKQPICEIEFPENLKKLEIIKGNITSMKGIETAKNLKLLSLCYLSKLQDFSSIKSLENLEYLSFSTCSKLTDLSFLENLPSLKYLILENCKSVKYLTSLTKIKGFKGVRLIGNTKTIDEKEDNIKKILLESHIDSPDVGRITDEPKT